MKRLILTTLMFCAAVHAAAPDDLACARRALGDELWSIAETHAVAAANSARDVDTRRTARLVQLEALAGAGRMTDMLARLDTWNDATNEVFRYWRAWAFAHAGRTNEFAAVIAQPFADAVLTLRARRLEAWNAFAAGDRDAADAAFRRASELLAADPAGRAENACDWARVRVAAGDYAGAKAVLESEGALKCAGAQGDVACLLAAEIAQRTGDAVSAGRYCSRLVAGGTNTVEAAFVPAACYQSEQLLMAGHTNDAVRVASNAVARATRPRFVFRAGEVLGFALLSAPDTRDAGRAYLTSLVHQFPDVPACSAVQLRLADALLAFGDAEGAQKEYNSLAQAFPAAALDAHVLEGRGWAALRLGLCAEAAGLFARAAQVATNSAVSARCRFKQADVLVAAERFEEAAKIYGLVTATNLADRACFHRADALARAGHVEEAEQLFRALFDRDGSFAVEAGLRAAAISASVGKVEEAIAIYGRLLDGKAAQPPSAEQRVRALSGRGRALYHDYRFHAAEADFAAAAELDAAQHDRMEFLRVLCLYGDRRDREAASTARKLLKSSTDAALICDLQFWLAKYDAAQREWSTAVAGFTTVATNAQNSAAGCVEALVRAARCATELSDFPKVVELVGRAVTNEVAVRAMEKESATSAWIAEGLTLQGEALVELGRFEAALLVLERARRVPAGTAARHRASLAYADCLLAGGADDSNRYTAALAAYTALAQEAELSLSMRLAVSFMSARALEKLHRTGEAMDRYYSDVVCAYMKAARSDARQEGRARFDDNARALFARAVFLLADYYESRGETRQAERVLGYLVKANAEEQNVAKRRIERLRRKGGF